MADTRYFTKKALLVEQLHAGDANIRQTVAGVRIDAGQVSKYYFYKV